MCKKKKALDKLPESDRETQLYFVSGSLGGSLRRRITIVLLDV